MAVIKSILLFYKRNWTEIEFSTKKKKKLKGKDCLSNIKDFIFKPHYKNV